MSYRRSPALKREPLACILDPSRRMLSISLLRQPP